jgi:membrane protein YqaA with SNARE-associated domain
MTFSAASTHLITGTGMQWRLPTNISVLLSVLVENPVWTWLHRLGDPGLILLGLVDTSAIRIPGSMDVLVVILSAQHREWWPYYALMATVGAVIGGYLTYRLAEKGGKATLEKKIGKKPAEKLYHRFERHGFGTVAIGAVLPRPFPIVPLPYVRRGLAVPPKEFHFGAWHRQGSSVLCPGISGPHLWSIHHRVAFAILQNRFVWALSLAGTGLILAVIYLKWYRPKRQREGKEHGEPVEAPRTAPQN